MQKAGKRLEHTEVGEYRFSVLCFENTAGKERMNDD
jgi:hypothetical protein